MKEDKTENLKKEMLNPKSGISPFRVIAMIVSIFVFLFGFFYFRNLNANYGYNNPSSGNTSSSKDNISSSSSASGSKEISVSDPKVSIYRHLFGYENSSYSQQGSSIYIGNTVNLSEISAEQKATITLYYYLHSNLVEGTTAKCLDLNSQLVQFQCNADGLATKNGVLLTMYQITYTKLQEAYQRIFGKDGGLNYQSFNTLDGFVCGFSNPNYNCVSISEKAIGIESYSYIIRAIEHDDKLEIFTKYVWLEGNIGYSNIRHDEVYFDNYQPKSGLNNNENIRTTYGSKIKTYVHTFSKDTDGNYYWDKTEPAK